jgi:hypothetical protein
MRQIEMLGMLNNMNVRARNDISDWSSQRVEFVTILHRLCSTSLYSNGHERWVLCHLCDCFCLSSHSFNSHSTPFFICCQLKRFWRCFCLSIDWWAKAAWQCWHQSISKPTNQRTRQRWQPHIGVLVALGRKQKKKMSKKSGGQYIYICTNTNIKEKGLCTDNQKQEETTTTCE